MVSRIALASLFALTACGSVEATRSGDIHTLDYRHEGLPIVEVMSAKADEICPKGYETISESKVNSPPTWRWKIRCISE